MTQQTPVPHEYGDAELEIFACGYTRGWKWRPCPNDPRFPKFEDYDLGFPTGRGRHVVLLCPRSDADGPSGMAAGRPG